MPDERPGIRIFSLAETADPKLELTYWTGGTDVFNNSHLLYR